MAKKYALNEAVLEFQDIVKDVVKSTSAMLKESVKEDIGKKLTEKLDDEDEESTSTDTTSDTIETSDDDAIETSTTDDEGTETDLENNEDIPSDESGDDVVDIALGDETPEIGADETGDSPLDVVGDDDSAISLDGETETSDAPIDTDLSDVIGDVVDGTGLSDDELVRLFKDVTDETDIQVTKDDDNTISFSNGQEKYIIKLNENDERMGFIKGLFDKDEENTETSADTSLGDNETMYEIELEENVASVEESAPVTEDDSLDEAGRTHADGRKMVRKSQGFYDNAKDRLRKGLTESVDTEKQNLITESVQLKDNVAKLIKENEELNSEIDKYSNALVMMKEELDKVALVNTKAIFTTRLFVEHATSQKEKVAILERFDNESIKDKKDVQALFKTISKELSSEKLNEGVKEKLKSSVGASADSLLTESEKNNGGETKEAKVINEQIERWKHLMNVPNKKA